ncbi:hypothetical protein D3C75_1012240 [compost metagenome]
MNGLSPFRVRNTDYGSHHYRRMRRQCRFNLHRVHIETAADDHVLQAVDDVQIALGIEVAQVTRLPGSVLELCRRRFRILVVTLNNGFAADPNLAGFSNGQWITLRVCDENFDPGRWASGG